MWYQQNEEYRLRVNERDWNEMRQSAALRRLARAARQESGTPSLTRRAIIYLEQLFSPHPVTPILIENDLSREDAEFARLLSLLASDGRVLRVENFEPVPEAEEEPYCRPIA
ncbi:MAG TPA: hypothetical protein VFA78_09730 [Chloroflexota bacterium]|nr:hypothetical protein [Chloroflexota bacterium]